MKHRILMVIPNSDLRDYVLDVLEERFNGSDIKMEIVKEDTFQDAIDKCGDPNPYSLVISQLHIARHRKAPLVETDTLGLKLFRELSVKGAAVPGILLTPYLLEKLETQVRQLPDICLVIEGNEWDERIVKFAERAFNGPVPSVSKTGPPCATTTKKHKKVRLEVYIYPYEGTWLISFVGCGGVPCNPKPHILRVNPTEINSIREKGNRLDETLDKDGKDHPDWVERLSEIGKNLVQEIIRNNQETMGYYRWLSGQVGGSEHFSIRFSTSEEAYPLLLEAILVPESKTSDDFWMLKAPICRHVDVGDTVLWPLFEDPEGEEFTQKINCLIIEADTCGWIKDCNLALDKIDNISKESKRLEDKLKSRPGQCHVHRISGQACTKERVRELLTNGERQWHLVHYAGHSLYQDKGYVFFPKDGMPDPVEIRIFGQWLRLARTRLIYLSGCQSCKIDFVRELARNGVPSALGFRWKINDEKAAGHADIFYDNLFKERSLEEALLKTRQKVWETNPDHRMWAAPVLMMQAHQ
jgi:hypothetical protein